MREFILALLLGTSLSALLLGYGEYHALEKKCSAALQGGNSSE